MLADAIFSIWIKPTRLHSFFIIHSHFTTHLQNISNLTHLHHQFYYNLKYSKTNQTLKEHTWGTWEEGVVTKKLQKQFNQNIKQGLIAVEYQYLVWKFFDIMSPRSPTHFHYANDPKWRNFLSPRELYILNSVLLCQTELYT